VGLYLSQTLVQSAGHRAVLVVTAYGLVPMVLVAFALAALRTAHARERTDRVVPKHVAAGLGLGLTRDAHLSN